MVFEKNASKISLQDYLVNPINNQSAVKCLVKSTEYSFGHSGLQKYLNEQAILNMVELNVEISNILKKFDITVKVNKKILNHLMNNHLPHTREIALGITKYLPNQYKSEVNQKALSEATSLHDIAKAIIPENIINKSGALDDAERKIMKEHARLSYEMLKTTGLSKEALHLIKNHHQNPQETNSLNSDKEFISDINLQILSISDVYSALREERSYKSEMSKEKALSIINKEVQKGKFHPYVYNALVDYANKEESQEINPTVRNFSLNQTKCFSR